MTTRRAHGRAFNPTDSPVVIDDEGHLLGGREWAELNPDDPTISALAASGRLVFPDNEQPHQPEPAAAADTTPQE